LEEKKEHKGETNISWLKDNLASEHR